MTTMFRRLFGAGLAATLALATGCTTEQLEDDDAPPALPPLPEFVDDCSEDLNDDVDDAAGLVAENQQVYEDIRLCDNERDYYRIDIPAQRWVSVEMTIHGLGNSFDGTDFDLWEVDEDGDRLWGSYSERLDYERVAFFNPTDAPMTKYLMVEGAEEDGTYDLTIRRSRFHEGMDCDAFYPDEDPDDSSGPCNRIMQFPQMNDASEGLFVEHPPYWSNLRREVTYLVRYAAQETADRFENTNPLATLDMSERDGATPGTSQGRLRHPETTHENGNDIDIAYYQTGEDNAGRAVCRNDGYFCTAEPDILDVPRTAFFTLRLLENDNIRVIGMDTWVVRMIRDAVPDLVDDEIITEDEGRILRGSRIASGDGWPFHHHHMHVSWTFERGQERSVPVEGCMTEAHALEAFPPRP